MAAQNQVPDGAEFGETDAIACVTRSRACIGLIGRDGHVAAFSQRLAEALGFERPEETHGRQILSLCHPDDRTDVERAFTRALNGCTDGAHIVLSPPGARAARQARVTFGKGPGESVVLMTLDRLDA